MNKTNNLRAYLRDLYEGIVSKKPDASRNPQNFRSEIEAIRTGGEFYEVMDESELPNDAPDGSLALVEGEPIPEAYTASSIDELPTNAVVGSLAKVKAQHSFYGEYWLSPIISMPFNQFEGVFFECDGVNYKTVIGYGILQYEDVTGNQITVYENNAWIDEKYAHLKVYSGENTAFKVWLNENKEYFQGAETWEFYEARRYANGIKWYIIDPNHVTVVQE